MVREKNILDFDQTLCNCWITIWHYPKKFQLPRWRWRGAGSSQRVRYFKKMRFFCFCQPVKMAWDSWNSTKKKAVWVSTLLWVWTTPFFSDQNSFLYPRVEKLHTAKFRSCEIFCWPWINYFCAGWLYFFKIFLENNFAKFPLSKYPTINCDKIKFLIDIFLGF